MKKLIALVILSAAAALAVPAHLGPIDPFPPDPCKDKRGKTPDCPVEHPIVSVI